MYYIMYSQLKPRNYKIHSLYRSHHTIRIIPPIPRHQHPRTSPDRPPPYFPFPLAAPANTEVSLPLQLMKATVPAESYILLSFFIVICTLQRCQLPLSFLLFNIFFISEIVQQLVDSGNTMPRRRRPDLGHRRQSNVQRAM